MSQTANNYSNQSSNTNETNFDSNQHKSCGFGADSKTSCLQKQNASDRDSYERQQPYEDFSNKV